MVLFCLQKNKKCVILYTKGRLVLMKEILGVIAELEFIDTDECYECKDVLREKYALLSQDAKKIYKWYFFYQLCILKYPLKNALWCYIVGENNGEKVEEEYQKFLEHRENIKRKM